MGRQRALIIPHHPLWAPLPPAPGHKRPIPSVQGWLLWSQQLCWLLCPWSTAGAQPSLRMLPCCHLSSPSFQVFLSTKRGSWVLYQVADSGYPSDFSYISRFTQLLQNLLPRNVVSFFVERKLNARFDHTLYGLKPKHR